MKNLLYTAAFILLTTLPSFSQAPFNTPDNIGAGNCLTFDGVNDYINIPNIAAYDFGTGDFTIEAWAFLNNLTEGAIISSLDAFDDVGFSFHVRGNFISFQFGCTSAGAPCNSNGSSAHSFAFNTNEWTHVAGVRSGNDIFLYKNGVQVASSTLSVTTQTLTSGKPIRIGRDHADIDGSAYYVDGSIDEVLIWNVARTQAQIRDDMCRQLTGTETGLVGYWNMNEGTGDTIHDITTNNNHGLRQ
ncbi:LamG domain-containing protein [Flavobacteriales bacterium]|nr:LamG domain-containing protein [Flavobacteriales bacterium]